MAKILFSDIDGTLISNGEAISQKNLDKMKEMQEKGHKIALCTGRNHIDIQPVLKHIPIPYDYLVLCNGSYIEDKDGHLMFEEHISKEIGNNVIREALERQDIVVCFCGEKVCPVWVNGETKSISIDGLEDSPEDFFELLAKEEKFYMLSLHHKDLSVEKIREFAKHISKKYPGIETHLNQQYVDVSPKGHNKGTGLKKLVSLLADIDVSYAIGDSFNDLSMIKEADVGVTFKYAVPEIQDEADKVVQYVYELIDQEIL